MIITIRIKEKKKKPTTLVWPNFWKKLFKKKGD